MASIFPNTPVGTLPPETVRLFRLLKRLPDGEYAVWQRLTIWSEPGPDFWVLHRSGRSLLLKVSLATSQEVRQANQGRLFGDDGQGFCDGEMEALQSFVATLENAGCAFGPSHLPAYVVFPSVPGDDLQRVVPDGVRWAGRDDLAADGFSSWVDAHLGDPLSQAQVDRLRTAISPEVVVPATLTVRQPLHRDTTAKLTDYLLSYDQERALKADLDLSDEAQVVSGEFGLQLVSGVAGSGKSLLVIYRAWLLRQFFPQKRILVLTHNRPLIRDLEARYQRISGGDTSVEWRTFHSWCQAHWPADEEPSHPVG
jgi:hypothetical protein